MHPKLKEPVFFLNFKTYDKGTGAKAIALAKEAEEVAKKTNSTVALVVQALDLRAIASAVSIPVFSQHIDPVSFGSNTGKILPEAVKEAGAIGTIINHAENKRDNGFVQKAVQRAKEAGLTVMVCAETTERAKEVAAFSSDLIAIEPPELIGGTVSVSTANPKIISDSVKAVHSIARIPVIAGAGVNSAADVKKSIELGASGVFVASAVLKAENPAQVLAEMIKGFK
ncbi:MAG: triose-phosphate isomerase [Candidatus Diapherotrites archaeon]